MNFETGKFYISGPMTGIKNYNRKAFIRMESKIKERFPDAVVLSPVRHPEGMEYEQYMKYALIDVEHSNIVVLLPDWHKSPGAQTERAHAVNLGKNIIPANVFDSNIDEWMELWSV